MKLEFDRLVVLDRVTRLIDADNGLCKSICELELLFPFVILFECFKFLFVNTDVRLVFVKLDISVGFVCNTAAERANWFDVDIFAVATDRLVLIVLIFGLFLIRKMFLLF